MKLKHLFLLLATVFSWAQETAVLPEASAEISVKEGGSWNGRVYEGGTFVNKKKMTVPDAHTDHSFYIRYEGPGWESEKVGYRLYLDWRNAIDVFGKRKQGLALRNVGQDGFDSYHAYADWGQDILKVGPSLGIGGYARYADGKTQKFEEVGETEVCIRNTPKKSTIHIEYEDWKVRDILLNLDAKISIKPGDRFSKITLKTNKTTNDLCTGIVKHDEIPLLQGSGKEWAYIATHGPQVIESETELLGMGIVYRKTDAVLVPEDKENHLLLFSEGKKHEYWIVAAWSEEMQPIKDQSAFTTLLEHKIKELEK